MRTTFCVEAFFCHAQSFHRTPTHKVFVHNGCGIIRRDVPVPNRLRIDHHHGTVLTLIQASGLVDAYTTGQTCVFRQLLQPGVQIALSIARARAPRRVGWARIMANKDVVFENWQAAILLISFASRLNPAAHFVVESFSNSPCAASPVRSFHIPLLPTRSNLRE
jgi:hypothetical protein